MRGFRYMAAGLSWAVVVTGAAALQQGETIQIGMSKAFFPDLPAVVVNIAAGDFKKLMKEAMSLDGELTCDEGAAEIAAKLRKKELSFGILHAHEFARVRDQNPDLIPFMVAISKAHERTYVVVKKDSPFKTVGDLRGKKFDFPMGASDPCRAFLESQGAGADAKDWKAYFQSVARSASQSASLDDVARGKADATVVDVGELKAYKEIRGPVFAMHLRVLQESPRFLPAVLVYQRGAVSPATLQRFRDGLRNVPKIKDGRALMKDWTIDSFAAVPDDYVTRLAEFQNADRQR